MGEGCARSSQFGPGCGPAGPGETATREMWTGGRESDGFIPARGDAELWQAAFGGDDSRAARRVSKRSDEGTGACGTGQARCSVPQELPQYPHSTQLSLTTRRSGLFPFGAFKSQQFQAPAASQNSLFSI